MLNSNKYYKEKTKILVIYSEIDDKRFLPYSIVFDLLNYFNDEMLTNAIQAIFNKMPCSSHYSNQMDLWIDLESQGETTALIAKNIATVIKNYLQQSGNLIHLIIKLHAKINRDNQMVIHFLQDITNVIKIIYRENRIAEETIHYGIDTNYLSWFDVEKHVDFQNERYSEKILQYASRCAEIGAEEISFRILENSIKTIQNPNLKKLFLSQLKFLRTATQRFLSEEQSELSITKSIASTEKPRSQMTSLNSLNSAHLYENNNAFTEAKKQYDRAFETVRGIKSETDFVFSQVCYGQLYEKQESHRQALFYWLKAAVHWLVTENKDALGWRAVRAIAIPDFIPRNYLNCDKIHLAFINKLTSLSDKCELKIPFGKYRQIKFIPWDNQLIFNNPYAIGVDGLSVIVDQFNLKELLLNELEEKLAYQAFHLLAYFLKFSPDAFDTCIIDRMNYIDFPTHFADFLRSCLLLSISQCVFNSRRFQIDDNTRQWLSNHLIIKPSSSIQEFFLSNRPCFVKHHRYLQKNELTPDEARLLLVIQKHQHYPHLQERFDLDFQKIIQLMKRKLISAELSECLGK